jgi:hypothetical protein
MATNRNMANQSANSITAAAQDYQNLIRQQPNSPLAAIANLIVKPKSSLEKFVSDAFSHKAQQAADRATQQTSQHVASLLTTSDPNVWRNLDSVLSSLPKQTTVRQAIGAGAAAVGKSAAPAIAAMLRNGEQNK